MKKGAKIAVSAVAVVAVVGAVGGSIYLRASTGETPAAENTAEQTSSAVEQAIPVTAEAPQIGSLSVSTDYIGKIQPNESVNVFPKLSGTVLSTHYEVGDTVNKGDLLFTIDGSDLATQVAVAEAGYKVAQASVDSVTGSQIQIQEMQADLNYKNALNSYKAAKKALEDYDEDYEPNMDALNQSINDLEDNLDEARAVYEDARWAFENYQSQSNTSSGGLIDVGQASGSSDAQLQVLKMQLDSAESYYNSLNQSYQQTKSSYRNFVDGRDPQMKQLRAALDNAELALESAERQRQITLESTIPETQASAEAQLAQAKANYEATVSKMGDTQVFSPISGVIEQKNVEANNMASTQQASYIISNKSIMTVRFGVPAKVAQEMKIGDSVVIESGSAKYEGSVVEISTLVDAQSGLFPVKARVDAPEGSLLSGLSVKVNAITERAENAVLIPVDALYYEDAGPYVYVVNADGFAKKTHVETGITNDDQIEIISGLNAASQVVTSWSPLLVDGAKVSLATANGAAALEPEKTPSEPAEPESTGNAEPAETSGSPETPAPIGAITEPAAQEG